MDKTSSYSHKRNSWLPTTEYTMYSSVLYSNNIKSIAIVTIVNPKHINTRQLDHMQLTTCSLLYVQKVLSQFS